MECKIIQPSKHGISNKQIHPKALEIIDTLVSAGFVAYLVGGGVRDLLLDVLPKDFDIATSALPEEIKKIFSRKAILIGKRFRLAHIRFGNHVFEVSTFRGGDTETNKLIVRDNVWGTPEEDAHRRDFTINGLFYDPQEGTILDYVGGWVDIQKRLLRTIGTSFLRFKQDPVRMLRLLKFRARFDFKISDEAHTALIECRHEIVKSSPSRLLEELLRMLESGCSNAFIQLLHHHGLLSYLLPTLAEHLESPLQEKIICLLEQIDLIVQDKNAPSPTRALLLAALFYPSLEKFVHQHTERTRSVSFDQIRKLCSEFLHEILDGFLSLPKNIQGQVIYILANQYRLTPIKRKRPYFRVPKEPLFKEAMHLLALRVTLDPTLSETLQEWLKAINSRKKRDAATQDDSNR